MAFARQFGIMESVKPITNLPNPSLASRWTATLAALAFATLTGCSNNGGDEEAPLPKEQREFRSYVETGDLPMLTERGQLRILTPRPEETYLPREGSPLYAEQRLAAKFAQRVGVKPVLVYVDDFSDLIPALLEGRGDIIAANLTVTDARREQIAFTVPVDHSTEQLVTRSEDNPPASPADLAGRTVAVRPATSFWESAQALKAKQPDLSIQALSNTTTLDGNLERLARGEIDLTITDSNVLDVVLGYRDDIQAAFPVSEERPLAWGVRPDNPELLDALNRFLSQEQLTQPRRIIATGDLPDIKKRKTLRVLTTNSAATYFLWRGELLGFEYELTREFAKSQGLRVEVIVAPTHEKLLQMLVKGQGDVAAAFLSPTEARLQQGVAFSRPYHYATEVVVGRSRERDLESVEELAGRRIAVRRSSSYWETLNRIAAEGVDLKIQEAPEALTTEELIALVADGTYDLTVADSHILDIEMTWRDDIKGLLALGEPVAHGWAVRDDNPKLLAAIDKFFRKEYRGVFYNITYKKYFESEHYIVLHREERVDLNADGRISPYDDIVQKYADEYGFDWRLVVAQMFQESRFDPDAKSWAGAKGLMQVLPRTAREFGFHDLEDPDEGIHAGVRYLDWLRERWEPELDVRDRMWFTLASYNAGPGHVRDARRLARRMGWNGDRWFGHVERAMLMLANAEYAKKARHGYVRGRETVDYVRKIRDRYNAYVLATERRMAVRPAIVAPAAGRGATGRGISALAGARGSRG